MVSQSEPSMRAQSVPSAIIALVLLALAVWHLLVAFRAFVLTRAEYVYADWMINYAAGFVRRGLGGEIILAFSGMSGLSPQASAYVLVAVLTVCFFGSLFFLLRNALTPLDLAILVSPPGLLFAFHNLEPGRKDILVLSLIVLAWTLVARFGQDLGKLTIAFGLFALLALTSSLVHEPLLFFILPAVAPFGLAFIKLSAPLRAWLFPLTLVALLAAVFALLAVFSHVDQDGVAAICGRLGSAAPDNCLGPENAIGWLQRDLSYSLLRVSEGIRTNYLATFGPGFAVGFAACAYVCNGLRLSSSVTRLPWILRFPLVHVVAAWVSTIPMYLVALDWGRWYSIWFIASCLHAFVGHKLGYFVATRPRNLRLSGWLVAIAIGVTSLVWNIPECCRPRPGGIANSRTILTEFWTSRPQEAPGPSQRTP